MVVLPAHLHELGLFQGSPGLAGPGGRPGRLVLQVDDMPVHDSAGASQVAIFWPVGARGVSRNRRVGLAPGRSADDLGQPGVKVEAALNGSEQAVFRSSQHGIEFSIPRAGGTSGQMDFFLIHLCPFQSQQLPEPGPGSRQVLPDGRGLICRISAISPVSNSSK
jgi:hypothetical protein